MKRLGMIASALALAAAPALANDPVALAAMKDKDGADLGNVGVFETQDGLLFHIDVEGIAPGWHGFHVHQTGSCAEGFDAAGDHYNPADKGHGLMAGDGPHAGDLPNVHADDGGRVRADIHAAQLSIEGGDAPLFDEDGSAIIIHENPDSYESDAGAGGRIACGEIVRAEG